MALKASPSSQHQHCTDEAQKAEKSLQLTRIFVEWLPEDFLRQSFVFFFLLPFRFTLLLFWWCSTLFPFGVEPPALPCGLAWGFLPFPVKPCLRICLVQLFLMFRNFLLLFLVLRFLPLSFIVLPPTRLVLLSLLVNWLDVLFRPFLIVTPLCALSLFVLGMLIVSCAGVALARKKFLCTVTL